MERIKYHKTVKSIGRDIIKFDDINLKSIHSFIKKSSINKYCRCGLFYEIIGLVQYEKCIPENEKISNYDYPQFKYLK